VIGPLWALGADRIKGREPREMNGPGDWLRLAGAMKSRFVD
jgi:hypothetical protein